MGGRDVRLAGNGHPADRADRPRRKGDRGEPARRRHRADGGAGLEAALMRAAFAIDRKSRTGGRDSAAGSLDYLSWRTSAPFNVVGAVPVGEAFEVFLGVLRLVGLE